MIFDCDIETDGFLEHTTKLWVLGAISADDAKDVRLYHTREEVQSFLDEGHTLRFHNGKLFDIPALEKFGYDCSKCKIIDTLPLSWYCFPRRRLHGLEAWGEVFGIPKPPVTDWKNEPIEVYDHRVLEDCKIQRMLSQKIDAFLLRLYDRDAAKVDQLVRYLMKKTDVLVKQQETRWKFNKAKAIPLLAEIDRQIGVRTMALEAAMPEVPVYSKKHRPPKPFKQCGKMSVHGLNWKAVCEEHNIPFESQEVHKVQTGTKPPNAGSHPQIKDWLYSLGWEPEMFKYERNKETNEQRKIPQVSNKDGEICPCILRLAKIHPALDHLAGLGMLRHRRGIVNGMIRDAVGGFLTARCNGYTNTLRLKHKELVNLPSDRVPFGLDIRGLLSSRDGHVSLGSDLASLEDRIKHHYQWPLDPEYVKMQMAADFDPHIAIAEMAGMLSKELADGYRQNTLSKSVKNEVKLIRARGKGTNYSCQYGAYPKTVARTAGVCLKEGEILWNAYHKLNWTIPVIADAQITKTCGDCKWLKNPINGFWYWLKVDRDKFSTLVQGTASYVFDMWCFAIWAKCIAMGIPFRPNGQFHDEVILEVLDGLQDKYEEVVLGAIKVVNTHLKTNREFACDVQFDTNYAGIH